jgi:hypothetical protein
MSNPILSSVPATARQATPALSGKQNTATRVVASTVGILAGLLGLEHGFFEIQQGQGTPSALIISAIGAPCQSTTAWHACEPAMTLLPTFFSAGLLTILVALLVVLWAAALVQRPYGGLVLLLLSLILLLVGGGFIPPLLGLIAGVVGTRINAPLRWWRPRLSGATGRFLAMGWPWVLILFVCWEASEWLLGSVFNTFLLHLAFVALFCTLGLLFLAILTGLAHDVQRQIHAEQWPFRLHG